jgi:HAD superfamily hydrolase (TIGR01490 family)
VLVPNISKPASDRIRWHQNEGHQIVLLSASPAAYLEDLARELRADALIATRLIWQCDCLTGEIDGKNCKGSEKLSRLIECYNGKDIDWRASYSYADSISDLPVFEKVGHPVVINPHSKLQRLAVERKWPIEYWYS